MSDKETNPFELRCEICNDLVGYTNSEDVIVYSDKIYCKKHKREASKSLKDYVRRLNKS